MIKESESCKINHVTTAKTGCVKAACYISDEERFARKAAAVHPPIRTLLRQL